MQARMKNPVLMVPEAMKALQALGASTHHGPLPANLLEIVHLRASQINGCSVCVDGHAKLAKKAGETDERLFAVSAWRDAPYFNEAERAALALTEAVTRIGDRSDPVPDDVWNDADNAYGFHKPAGCRVATLRRFQTLMLAMARSRNDNDCSS